MTYFIVNTPYEQCFKFFFNNELGYPSFYRLAEILPEAETVRDITVLAACPEKLSAIEKVLQSSAINYQSFGKEIATCFQFNQQGQVNTSPTFLEALSNALKNFPLISSS